jgi:transcriptional regulator with XRE-family HTH domain
MSQTNNLLLALKKQLRAQGKTYADVAQLLDLSEASVKRLFASQSFTLQRLEQLCDWLQIEFSELMQQAQQQPQLTQLTLQQEQDIAADQLLLLVAVSVINGFSFQDLQSHYALTEPECVRKLAALDRLKIIDLLPGKQPV